MEITGILILAADTVLLPTDMLSEELRRQVQAVEGDYAITRRHSRTSARLVDGNSARLLEEFRQPSTVVQAVLRYCSLTNEDPEATLDGAFPMLERLVHSGFLVASDSPQAQSIRPLLDPGDLFAGTEILACLQTLEDTDLYRVKTVNGQNAALKLMRSAAGPEVSRMFEREASVLRHLDAKVTPALLASDTENGLPYLLLSWCSGSDCASVAAHFRASGDYAALLRLSLSILDAYAHLHAQNVIHSDVHPRNILVDNEGAVRIVDFGFSRLAGVENEFRRSERGGIGYYFEPEYARSARGGVLPPCSTILGEQYSLAALLYFLITGKHYVDFSLERDEMLRQIAEDSPLAFRPRGFQPWPAVEDALVRALAKDPAARFESVTALAAALGSASAPATPVIPLDHGEASYLTAQRTLTQTLSRLDIGKALLRTGLTSVPGTSITYGSAGVACALHRIAYVRGEPKLLALADLWGERASRETHSDDAWYSPEIGITPEVVGRVSPYHTESGVHFIQALIAHSMGDVGTQQNALDGFIRASLVNCDSLDLTLGRSGTLWAASHLLAALSPTHTVNIAALRELGNNTMASIWRQLDSYASIAECREIRFSGIAHGWAGILYATLCWSRASGVGLPPHTGERLDQLAALAHRSGSQATWDWNIHREPRDAPGSVMGGWCNGTAGQVHLWLAAHFALKEERYFVLAQEAARHAAEVDTRDGSLCCGFAGQSYAMLSLYRKSGERVWLHRAQLLAEKAAVFYRDLPLAHDSYATAARPNSLYKGELGVAVLAADLQDPDESAQPAFDFIEY
jgi:eukaryotic-like serine/threonine-protein kinase